MLRIFLIGWFLFLGCQSAVRAQQDLRLQVAVFADGSTAQLDGPEKARGAVIWSHGRNNLRVQSSLPPAVLIENLSHRHWDAFVLRRIDGADREHDMIRALSQAVDVLKDRGYRRIVLAGQSAGAFGSLRVAGKRADVFGVIALAPACCGAISMGGSYTAWFGNANWVYDAVERLNPTRVVIAFFRDDPFSPERRGPRVSQVLARSGLPNWVIDEPEEIYLSGHGAGQGYQFAARFGACIARFLEEGLIDCGESPTGLRNLELPPAPMIGHSNPGSGLWAGIWESGRAMMLGVDPQADGRLKVHYILGTGAVPRRERPEHSIFDVEMASDGSFGFSRFHFQPLADGRILASQDLGAGMTRKALLRPYPPEQMRRVGMSR